MEEAEDQESEPIGDTSDLGRRDPLQTVPQVRVPLGSDATSGGSQYSLTFILGRDGSPAIWQGAVTAVLPASDPFDVASGMVPVLTDHIGQTARKQEVQFGF